MFTRLTSKKILYRLLLSYFIIFIIPLIVLTGILYKTWVVDLQREIEYSNLHKLNQLRDTVDMRFNELSHQANLINLDLKLSHFSMTQSTYKRYEGIDRLSIYRTNNAFTEGMYIYYKGYNSIFSGSGEVSIDNFLKYVYILGDREASQFKYDINTVMLPTIKIVEDVKFKNNTMDVMPYYYPIAYGNNSPYATVIYLVKRQMFDNMMTDILGDLPGIAFVLDGDDNILISNINREFPYVEESKGVIGQGYNPGIHSMTLGGEQLAMISTKSQVLDWTFVTLIQTSQLFKTAKYMRTMTLQIVFGILAFGIFLISVLVGRNYKPIRNIVSYIGEQSLDLNGEQVKDEMDLISRTIVSALSQKQELQAQIDMQRPMIRSQVLANLLKGNLAESDLILINATDVRLKGPYYSVAVAKGLDKHVKFDESLYCTLDKKLEAEFNVYTVAMISNGMVAFLFNLDQADVSSRSHLMSRVRNVFVADTGYEIILGVGKPYSDISNINHSFIEALTALDYNLGQRDEILFFEDMIDEQDNIYWYPLENQLRFMQGLKQGDRLVALDALEAMFNSINSNQSSALMVRYICFDIINSIIKLINELGMEGFGQIIDGLMDFKSLSQLESNLAEFVNEFCNWMSERQDREESKIFMEMKDYIDGKFTDYNLSLNSISDVLEMPTYYLSRLFKDRSGETFTDYLTNLRIERSKDLLRDTESNIKEIAPLVGYADITSFTRRFKQIEGITPGRYRDLHRST